MDNQTPQKPWYMDSLVFFSKISGLIIGPVLLAFIAAEIVTSKWPQYEWVSFVFFGLSFIASVIAIYKETLAHLKKLKQDVTDTAQKTDKDNG